MKLVAALGLFLFSVPCFAQRDIPARVDEFIHAEMERQRIPGLALAVIRDRQAILIKGYGVANVEHQVPVKPDTIFQSGSIAKQFTAMAVMLLAEEGRLSLADAISRYWPDMSERWKGITVRHLLTHTAGLGDYPADYDLRRDYTEEGLLATIKSAPLAHQPGAGWDYSNLGYVLSGILVHKVTGRFYGDFLEERVFRPLGMTTARVMSESDIVPNRAAGYRLVDGQLKNQSWVSPAVNTTADGSLYLTILDMARWDAALQGEQLARQSSLARMWTPVTLNDGRTMPYGFGWHTDVIHGRRVVFHGGGWQGFKSFIAHMPEEKLTITFFANLWQTREVRLARGLLAIVHPAFALPAGPPIEDREPQVTALVKRVLLQLSTETADSGLFTPGAQADVFPRRASQIRESLNGLSLPIAIISSIDLVGRKQEGELRAYRYVLTDLGKSLFCTIKLTKDDGIAGLQVGPV